MIPRETIEQVFAASKIEEVVSDYVSLKRRGANMIGLCPFHNEKTGSFTVSPGKGIYKCFGCGKSGHAVGFVMEIEQCGFADAVRQLAKKYHIPIEEREMTPEEVQRQDDRESMFVVNEFANKWFQKQLWETAEGKMAGLGYLLQKRGIREDIIRRFQLGYSPDRSLLSDELKQKGFQEKYLLNDSEHEPHLGTGVVCRSADGRLFDRFHSRVMFPFFSTNGKVIGFAGRILKPNDKVGKYVNSPTSPLFEKKNELYGFFQAKQAIQRQNMCYLVEGQLDVISMVQAGIENVVSSGGTSLTVPQIRLIRRFTPNITIIYDGDKAGIKAALRGIDMVLSEGMNVRIVLLPEGQDPDEFARSHNADELVAYIESNATDFIQFKTSLLAEEAGNDPQQLAALINDIVDTIACIPDIVTRQVYLKYTASGLRISEQILSRRLNQVLREQRSEKAKERVQEERKREQEKLAQQMEQAADNTAPVETPHRKDSLEENYRNLLQVVVRYGEYPLYEMENGAWMMTGEYIISELQADAIEPPTPLFARVVSEYLTHRQDNGFVAESFFKFHPDPEISSLAVDLIADRYQLSTMYSHQSVSENVKIDVSQKMDTAHLKTLVNQLLLELKLTVVNQRIDQLDISLKDATARNDWELVRTLMEGQPQLLAIRNAICQALGNRVLA